MSRTLQLLGAATVAAALSLIPVAAGATDQAPPRTDCRTTADGVVPADDGAADDGSVPQDDGAQDDGAPMDDGAVDDGAVDDGTPGDDGPPADDLVPEDIGDITVPDDGGDADGPNDLVPEDLGDLTLPDDGVDDLPPPDDIGDLVAPDGLPDDGADDGTPTDLSADGDLTLATVKLGSGAGGSQPCPVPQDGIQTGAGGTSGGNDATGALLAGGVGALALAAGVSAARSRRRTTA